MQDRYLFRGKRTDNAEWVVGGYAHTNIIDNDLGLPLNIADCLKHHLIFESGLYYEVDSATIGQCTGLKDKNGKLIFERDIVEHDDGTIGAVVWSTEYNGMWQIQYNCIRNNRRAYPVAEDYWDNWTIIGNINDNPTLLKIA